MSATDGESLPSGLGKKRKRSPRVIIIAVIVIAVLVVGAVAWLTVQGGNKKSGHARHSPILINSNGGFTHANGVAGGSGTASDPYVIADWDIDASTSTGISIQGTDVHFIVRNCTVHGGSNSLVGIYLSHCSNGTLEYNNCSDDLNGITLDTSNSNNSLIKNICSSNSHDGITLGYSSDNNALTKNTCNSNGYDGVYLVWSNNNPLTKNTCSSNGNNGIHLGSSGKNTLDSNVCSSNGHHGIGLDLASNSNDIYGNQVSKNGGYGIVLNSSSNNNAISFNGLSNNVGCGVDILSGSNNSIVDNAFIDNNGATVNYDISHAQARDDGMRNRWNYTYVNSWDEPGNYWSDWTTPSTPRPVFVESPYIILGSAGAKDFYPLTFDPRTVGIAFIP